MILRALPLSQLLTGPTLVAHVLVHGVPVVLDGVFQQVLPPPGRAVRGGKGQQLPVHTGAFPDYP